MFGLPDNKAGEAFFIVLLIERMPYSIFKSSCCAGAAFLRPARRPRLAFAPPTIDERNDSCR
jgi:hypothetical protein